MNLESAFKNFILTHAGARDIDSFPEELFSGRKADFFLKEKASVLKSKPSPVTDLVLFSPGYRKE